MLSFLGYMNKSIWVFRSGWFWYLGFWGSGEISLVLRSSIESSFFSFPPPPTTNVVSNYYSRSFKLLSKHGSEVKHTVFYRNGVSFLHSNPYDALVQMWGHSNVDNTLVFWLFLSSVYTVLSLFLILASPREKSGGGQEAVMGHNQDSWADLTQEILHTLQNITVELTDLPNIKH